MAQANLVKLYMKLLKVNAIVAFAVALSLRRIMWYNLV